MKRFVFGIVLGLWLLAAGGIGYTLVRSNEARVSPMVRRQCEYARTDEDFRRQMALSTSQLNREVAHNLYDFVLFERRLCAINKQMTTP